MFVEFNYPVFYIDNVEFPIDLGPGSGTTMNYSSNPGVIGNCNTEYFNGFIDDVCVYSRVLTLNEISTQFFECP